MRPGTAPRNPGPERARRPGEPAVLGQVRPGQYARSMHGAAESERRPAPDWQAPAAVGPVRSRLRPPGSKSVTNRALVLAALAGGPTVITNPPQARDTLPMAAALRALGSGIEDTSAEAGSGGGAPARRGATGRPVRGGGGGGCPRP